MKILKLAKQPNSNHLSKILNLSFSSGIFPERLKTAKVTPIFKKGSKLECSNYRPISLLFNLDKIIEKLMHERVMQFLKEHNILYQRQFSFQKNFSTAHAVRGHSKSMFSLHAVMAHSKVRSPSPCSF